jgi:ABC-type uncharacterized transport system ATPase subunit
MVKAVLVSGLFYFQMTDIAIRVEGIGKLYRVGERESYQHLRDVVAGAFRGSGTGKGRPKDTIWAVRDVSFDVHQGEVVGLIGRNGAGKSTLLKLLARITRPTVGRLLRPRNQPRRCRSWRMTRIHGSTKDFSKWRPTNTGPCEWLPFL